MKIGSLAQFNLMLSKFSDNPEKIAEIKNKLEWITPTVWVIKESSDGKAEEELIAKIKNTNVSVPVPRPTTHPVQTIPKPVEHKHPHQLAPHKKPPPFLHKIAQYLAAVTGPKVTKEVFDSRFDKCTKTGGCTFASVSGTVEDVGDNFIRVGNTITLLQSDEHPTVTKGDTVQYGQTVAKSNNSKPCPLLLVVPQKDSMKYFCNACGCGTRSKAELTNKLYYARATCPRTPPQFLPEDENGPGIQQ